jgi:hypothetical protein
VRGKPFSAAFSQSEETEVFAKLFAININPMQDHVVEWRYALRYLKILSLWKNGTSSQAKLGFASNTRIHASLDWEAHRSPRVMQRQAVSNAMEEILYMQASADEDVNMFLMNKAHGS